MKIVLIDVPLRAELVVSSALGYLGEALRRVRKELRVASAGGRYHSEVTHQLRVSSRKADVALRLLDRAGIRIDGKRSGRRLGRLRRDCGPLRDADVRWQRLLHWRAGAGERGWALLAGAVVQGHGEALRGFEEILSRRRRKLRRVLRRAEWDVREQLAKRRPVPRPRRLKRWLEEEIGCGAVKLVGQTPDDDLHRLRIESKDLRYALAAAGGELPAFETVATGLRSIHETFGVVHDCQVIQQWLDRFDETLRRRVDGPVDAWRSTVAAWRAALGEEIEEHLRGFDERRSPQPVEARRFPRHDRTAS